MVGDICVSLPRPSKLQEHDYINLSMDQGCIQGEALFCQSADKSPCLINLHSHVKYRSDGNEVYTHTLLELQGICLLLQ